jgi:phosphofructokinase-like protein
MSKKLLIVTGGGDCPGLNAVIRGVVKRAAVVGGWQVYGSIESFCGVLNDPPELKALTTETVARIHVQGGTILLTTNKGMPLAWPTPRADGSIEMVDRGDELISRIHNLGFDGVISIGGDGSQRISYELAKRGLNIIGVPKTIDNDLEGTDYTFGFQTAVQTATDAIDRLVTTAESHNRVMVVEVMGRNAGWIALHAAVAGGAEVCLIPEIPYDIRKVKARIQEQFKAKRGFSIVVVAEGARPQDGTISTVENSEPGRNTVRLGGVAYAVSRQLREVGLEADIREMVLGHLLRGGSPIAFDRILGTQFGVHAFDLAAQGKFGRLVSYQGTHVKDIPLTEAINRERLVKVDDQLVVTARGIGVCFGDS